MPVGQRMSVLVGAGPPVGPELPVGQWPDGKMPAGMSRGVS